MGLADNPTNSMPALYKPTVRTPTPERAVMLQRYLALHTQQSTVRKRLAESQSPSPPPSPQSMRASPEMSSSEPSSASPSPTLEGTRFFQLSPPAYALPQPVTSTRPTTTKRMRSSRPSIAPIPEDDSLDEFEVPSSPSEQRKLYTINHEIKTTLTDLLNCDAVRKDGRMRLWIQSRLMDAERELKRERRTKQRVSSSPTTPTILLTPSDDRRESV